MYMRESRGLEIMQACPKHSLGSGKQLRLSEMERAESGLVSDVDFTCMHGC
jgi:hypothetical protein